MAPPASPDGPRYRLRGEIGRGGLGRVVEAEDTALGRTVALKLLLDGTPLEMVERFRREGFITGRLEHPNIVPVHDAGFLPGEAGRPGELFFAMKRVGGRDFGELLDSTLSGDPGSALRRHVEILRDASRAVAYAHSRGVIHRDLKPSNIMVGDFGEVLLLDWGLAKEVGSGERRGGPAGAPSAGRSPALTLDGDIMGTPEYMAPEQAQGLTEEVDARSDVWALGAILYEILAGRPPFTGASSTEVLRRAASETPARPSDLIRTRRPASLAAGAAAPARTPVPSSVPPELEAICLRALARAPQDRHASAAEFAADLDRFLAGALERERRQELAGSQVAAARAAIAEWTQFGRQESEARERALVLARSVHPWDPPAMKAGIWQAEDAASDLHRRAAGAYAAADAALTSALSNVPFHAEARRLRSEIAWERFLAAEAEGNVASMALYRRTAEDCNDGWLDDALRDEGMLTVRTSAFPCRCLLDGRDVRPEELAVLNFHPWSGRRLSGPEIACARELEPTETLRLRTHGAACREQDLAGADVWAFAFRSTERLLIPVTDRAGGPAVPEAALDALYGDSAFRPRGPGRHLGRTPLHNVRLPMGSWLLVVAREGFAHLRAPVLVSRQAESRLDLLLLSPEEIPAGFLQIPGGPFPYQGDRDNTFAGRRRIRRTAPFLIARRQVLSREYAAWLNERQRTDPQGTPRLAPRALPAAPPIWPLQDGRWTIPTAAWLAAAPPGLRRMPETGFDTSIPWEEDWPVMAIAWRDACEYLLSLSKAQGRLLHLPHEEQWEKAARGADARIYPWGNDFDPTRCNMQASLEGGARPVAAASVPTDESPFGARDMAGNAKDYCLDDNRLPSRGWRATRGGWFSGPAVLARCATTSGGLMERIGFAAGFRPAMAIQVPLEEDPWV